MEMGSIGPMGVLSLSIGSILTIVFAVAYRQTVKSRNKQGQ